MVCHSGGVISNSWPFSKCGRQAVGCSGYRMFVRRKSDGHAEDALRASARASLLTTLPEGGDAPHVSKEAVYG